MAMDVKVNNTLSDYAKQVIDESNEQLIKATNLAGAQLRRALVKSTKLNLYKGPKGMLARSWVETGARLLDTGRTKLVVANPLPYAKIHQTGGTIVPTRAKALAIPNKDNTTFSGFKNRQYPSPRDVPSPHRELLWLDKDTGTLKDDKGQVAYFLRMSTKIPATNYVSEGVDNALPEVLKVYEDMLKDSMGAK